MYEGLKPCSHRKVDDQGRILCGLIKIGDREVSVNLCRACPVPQINCQHLRAAMQKKVATPITVRFATGRVEVWDDEAPRIGFKQAACSAKTMPIHTPRDCAGCPLRVPNVIPQNAIQVAHRNKPVIQPQIEAAASPPSLAESVIANSPAQSVAQQSVSHSAQAPAVNTGANDLVQRAQAVAAKKRAEAAVKKAATPRAESVQPGENKSKIILLQQWLADQFNKKQDETKAKRRTEPDVDGVQEIIYERLEPSYQEEAGLERCVGWTD